MLGLPWAVTEEEIEEFFEKFAYVRGSIRIGELDDGRKTGQGIILFENEDVAADAMEEKQRQHIGSRWIKLFPRNFGQFERFMDEQLNCRTVNLKRFLNEENLSRCLKLSGLPFKVEKQEIMDFFADYNLSEDDVVIEMRSGRKSGIALAFLNNEEDVQKA